MRPALPEAFAKSFCRGRRFPWSGRRHRFPDGASSRRCENPTLKGAALLDAGQRKRTPERRLANRGWLELALLEIERGKPPRVAAVERHGRCRVRDRRRPSTIPKAVVPVREQRQVIGASRLRALSVESLEGRLDHDRSFGALLLRQRPAKQRARPVSVVRDPYRSHSDTTASAQRRGRGASDGAARRTRGQAPGSTCGRDAARGRWLARHELTRRSHPPERKREFNCFAQVTKLWRVEKGLYDGLRRADRGRFSFWHNVEHDANRGFAGIHPRSGAWRSPRDSVHGPKAPSPDARAPAVHPRSRRRCVPRYSPWSS